MNSAGQNASQAGNEAGSAISNAASAVGNAADAAGDKIRNAADHAGAGTPTASNPAPDAKDIDSLLANVTNDALSKGDMDSLIGCFVDADRNRLKDDLKNSNDDDYGKKLDGRIEQIQQAWKSKYGNDFDLNKPQQVFTDAFVSIQQGKIGSDAQLASEVMKNSQDAPSNGNNNANGNSAGDENLENGRSIAVVDVKASHGAPELKVPLIHEMPDSWKINVPDGLTGQKLRQNLLNQLTACGEVSNQWPTNETEAYRAISHHVLMAVLDKSGD